MRIRGDNAKYNQVGFLAALVFIFVLCEVFEMSFQLNFSILYGVNQLALHQCVSLLAIRHINDVYSDFAQLENSTL